MKNPLTAIRKEKGLTMSELSVISEVSMNTIGRIEKGAVKKVTPEVLDTLEKLGYDRAEFERNYYEWRQFKTKELEAKMKIGIN